MDIAIQALIMGIVQGLTEFLPVSSSGHLILVPALLGWDDPFITSLAFSVMLHLGTLVALLVYFRERLGPARPGGPRRRCAIARSGTTRIGAWRGCSWPRRSPRRSSALLFNDLIETPFREPRPRRRDARRRRRRSCCSPIDSAPGAATSVT